MGRWSFIFLLLAACSNSGSPQDMGSAIDFAQPPLTCLAPTGPTDKYVADHLMIPMNSMQFAIDLNGDGVLDNALGVIASTLKTQGVDLQMSANQAILSGDLLVLFEQQSASNLDEDTCAQVSQYTALMPASPPILDGSDTFMVDTTISPGVFPGAVHLKSFASTPPSSTVPPVFLTLQIPLVVGQPPVKLHVAAAQLKYTRGNQLLFGGQLNGAVPKAQFDDEVLPSLTNILNTEVMSGSPNAGNILNLFDTGMCMNPNGTMAVAGDGKIDLCEVTGNAIVQGVTAPDVQIFDSLGNYAPNPANTNPDSVSIGVSFSAVKATFATP
jgi:hypothetical protein